MIKDQQVEVFFLDVSGEVVLFFSVKIYVNLQNFVIILRECKGKGEILNLFDFIFEMIGELLI